MNWGELYYDHFSKFFGDPVGRRRFRQSPETPAIQILSYEGVFPSANVFCTIGLSHYDREIRRRAEVYLPVSQGKDEVPSILANSLFFIIQQRMQMGWGTAIVIDAIAPKFVHKYNKSSLYFSLPFGLPEEFNEVSGNGESGKIYSAYFISSSEYDFFAKKGGEEFERIMKKKDPDVLDLSRRSAI